MSPPRFDSPAARSLAGLVPLVAVLSASPGASAQPTLPSASFEEALSVEVVNLEVFVANRKGEPVTGLTRDDFRLLEDGEPVEIEYFTESVGDRSPESEAAVAGPAEVPVEAPREPRHLVIYLDEANLAPAGRRRVLAGLREAITEGGDGADRLMIAAHDGGLRIVQPFTEDREAILQTLSEIEGRATGGIYRSADWGSFLRSVRSTYEKYEMEQVRVCPDPCACGWQEMEAAAQGYAGEVMNQVDLAVEALSQLVSALAGVTGRKSVLYVGDGLEQRAGLGAFSYVADVCPEFERELARNYLDYDQAPVFHRLTAHANANQVTLHTLEARGLQVDSDATAGARRFRVSTQTSRIRDANLQSPLFAMAADTAGKAVLDANAFAAEIEEIGRDYDTYYSLGFVSRHRGDGRRHRLEVEVEGRGYRVRHRNYYLDKPASRRLSERVWSSLLLGIDQNSLGLEIATAQPEWLPQGCCRVPIKIRLPLEKLVLLPSAETRVGHVYVVLTARSASGRVVPVRGKEIPVRATLDEPGDPGFREVVVELDLNPGAYDLAVGVLDLEGGEEAHLRRSIEVVPPLSGPGAAAEDGEPTPGGSEAARTP